MRFFLYLFLLFFICTYSHAQSKRSEIKGVELSEISEKDFIVPKSTAVDGNAGAVILSDIASVVFTDFINDRDVSYFFIKKTKIKIINKSAFDLATVRIVLNGYDDYADKLEDIKASTWNIENGKITTTNLNPADIYENRLGKYSVEKKFTMPDIKEGSVIEYSYKILSYHYRSLPAWKFQHQYYPCLYSEYGLGTPNYLKYLVVHSGVDSATLVVSDKSNAEVKNASKTGIAEVRKWFMKDIPAFKEEPFMNAPENYLDGIDTHLIVGFDGVDLSKRIASWKYITERLLRNRYFGEAVTVEKASNLYNTMETITALDNNLLSSAKNIYAYVRDNFACIKDDDIYLDNDLYEVNRKKKGSVAELNLLLIALLRQKGLIAEPVILSTRDYAVHPVSYPSIDKMNYVIARLKIFGDTLYLDATQPMLGFGKLPLDCYNGHARIISDSDTGDIYLYPEAVKELNRTTVFIQNDEKTTGLMTGNFQLAPGYHDSYDIRRQVDKQGMDNYLKELKSSAGTDLIIENAGIDSLKKPDESLVVHFDFKFTPGNNEDLLYYNPVMGNEYKANPFVNAERRYPIELPAPIDKLYIINMETPKGYIIDEMPKSAKVMFNGNEGFYEYIIQKDDTGIQLRSRIKLDRAIFQADEYKTLRDFFAFVVKKQGEQIVFKKKK